MGETLSAAKMLYCKHVLQLSEVELALLGPNPYGITTSRSDLSNLFVEYGIFQQTIRFIQNYTSFQSNCLW